MHRNHWTRQQPNGDYCSPDELIAGDIERATHVVVGQARSRTEIREAPRRFYFADHEGARRWLDWLAAGSIGPGGTKPFPDEVATEAGDVLVLKRPDGFFLLFTLIDLRVCQADERRIYQRACSYWNCDPNPLAAD